MENAFNRRKKKVIDWCKFGEDLEQNRRRED